MTASIATCAPRAAPTMRPWLTRCCRRSTCTRAWCGTSGTASITSRCRTPSPPRGRRSGQVRWRLGGKRSSFAMGSGTGLAWQHDAREQPDGTITFFDNGATPAAHPQSRAVALRLDPGRKVVSLVRRDVHAGGPLVAGSQGNVQALTSGDWLLGWGEVPYLSEFAPG